MNAKLTDHPTRPPEVEDDAGRQVQRPATRVRVLFIAGNGRSGSTMLHNVLGQIEGFTAVGELRYIWQKGLVKGGLCGCGQPIDRCEFWSTVLDDVGGVDRDLAEELALSTERFRTKHLVLGSVPGMRRLQLRAVAELRDTLDAVYRSIADQSGASVIVDSSKNPSFGYLVRELPSVDMYTLQFVRDSPAVAYSWGKPKEFEPGVMMARKSPSESALQWASRNSLTEAFLRSRGRYRLMRYEDFASAPRSSTRSVLEWLGEGSRPLPFDGEHDVALDRPNHSVFGNEVRFERGSVSVRADRRWREDLPAGDARMVKAITAPLRLRYGYIGPRARNGLTIGGSVR